MHHAGQRKKRNAGKPHADLARGPEPGLGQDRLHQADGGETRCRDPHGRAADGDQHTHQGRDDEAANPFGRGAER
jgi:hypothetical protein